MTSSRRLFRAMVLGVLAASFAQACGSDDPPTRAVGDSCLLPTDCPDPLACVFQRCHQQCLADRDCPEHHTCAGALAPKKGICLTAEEAQCSRNSDCPEPLVCDRFAHCNAQCIRATDCLASQTCVAGSCLDLEKAPADGGVPAGEQGQTCALASDCLAGLVCLSGRCTIECREERDCRSDETCADGRCYKRSNEAGVDATVDGSGDATLADGSSDAPPGYGKTCLYPSDCSYPLVCRATGVCGWECNLDPDCKSTETCKDHFCVARTADGGVDVGSDVGSAETGKACVASADCDDGNWCNGPEQCVKGTCAPAADGPCTSHTACVTDACDEATKKCTHTPTAGLDVDGDGHIALGCGGDDCDDKNATINPGALELCDGKDNDCDGKIDNYAVAPRGADATFALTPTRNGVVAAAIDTGWLVLSNTGSGTSEVRALPLTTGGTASPEKTLSTGQVVTALASAGSHFLWLQNDTAGKLTFGLSKADLTAIASSVLAPNNVGADFTETAATWNGTQYFIAFRHYGDVEFTFMKPDGTLTGGIRKLPDGADGAAGGAGVVVAASSGVHFVGYVQPTSKPSALLVSASGGLLAGPTELSSTSGMPVAAAVTASGFLVVVRDTSSSVLTARTMSMTGTLSAPVTLTGSTPLALAATETGFAVSVATTTALRFAFHPAGLGGLVEATVPFPTLDANAPRALASTAGPQLGLFALDASGTKLHYQRIGCAP